MNPAAGLMDMMKMGSGGLGFGGSNSGANNNMAQNTQNAQNSQNSQITQMTQMAQSASGPLMTGLSVSAQLPPASTDGAPVKRRAMKGPSGGAAPSMFLDPGKNSIMETLSGMM